MSNTTKNIISDFQKSKLRYQLLPMESSPSLPVPIGTKSNKLILIFYYTGLRQHTTGHNEIDLYAPNTRIVLSYPKGQLVYFANLTALKSGSKAWEKPVGQFPHDGIAKLKLNEYRKQIDQILIDSDQVLEKYYNGLGVDEFVADYKERYFTYSPQPILSFLKKEGGKFFSWLESAS